MVQQTPPGSAPSPVPAGGAASTEVLRQGGDTTLGSGLLASKGRARSGQRGARELPQSLGEHLVAQRAHEHRLPLSLRGWKGGKRVSDVPPFHHITP